MFLFAVVITLTDSINDDITNITAVSEKTEDNEILFL
jgi:hypothetical protein